MKYEVEERRKEAEAERQRRFATVCETYADSGSWAEFLLKTTLDGNGLGRFEKFAFWTYYMRGNYGRKRVIRYMKAAAFAAGFMLFFATGLPIALAGKALFFAAAGISACVALIPAAALAGAVESAWDRIAQGEQSAQWKKSCASADGGLTTEIKIPANWLSAMPVTAAMPLTMSPPDIGTGITFSSGLSPLAAKDAKDDRE